MIQFNIPSEFGFPLKLEALAKVIQDNCLKWNGTQSYTIIDELNKKINVIT